MSDLSLNRLIETFGLNAGYVFERLAEYHRSPSSLDAGWRRIFDTLEDQAPGHGLALPPSEPDATRPLPSLVPASTFLPGEEAVPITGSAAALVRNMEASLGIPTATSNRVIPVNVMEENRRTLNCHREVMGLRKISFTHIVA